MQQLENDLDEAQENLLAANAKLEEKDKALQNVSDSTWLILSHLSFYHDTVLDKLLDFFLTQYLRLFDYYSIIRSVLVWYATWTRRRENANLIERWFSNLRFSRFSRRNTAIVIERKSSTLVLIFFFLLSGDQASCMVRLSWPSLSFHFDSLFLPWPFWKA